MKPMRMIFAAAAAATLVGAAFLASADDACNRPIDYSVLGQTQYNNGDYQNALISYGCVLQLDSNTAGHYNNRGNTFRQLARYDEAIADYNRAIEIDPEYAMAYNNRGWAYYLKGDLAAALVNFNQAIALDDQLAYAYNNRGLIYHLQGQPELAAQDFSRAMELGLDREWARYNLRRVEADLALAQQPESASSVPISDAPTINGLLVQARTAEDARNWTAAVSLYTQAIVLDANNADAYYYRGRAYTALDQANAALADFERLVELRPNFVYAYWERAVAYAENGDFERAEADADRAERMDGTHVNNFIVRGTIAALAGDQAEAGAQFALLLAAWEVSHVESGELVEGTPVTVMMSEGRVVEIAMEGAAGETVMVRATSSQADPVIVLLDANGTALAGDDDSYTGLGSVITVTLPDDGTYTLLVSHAGGGSYGNVNVSVEID